MHKNVLELKDLIVWPIPLDPSICRGEVAVNLEDATESYLSKRDPSLGANFWHRPGSQFMMKLHLYFIFHEKVPKVYNLIQTLDQRRDQSSTLQEGRKWSCRWFDCGREIKELWNGFVAVKCKQGFSDWWLEHLTMPRQMFRNDDQGQLLWQLQPRWWWWR